MGMFARAVGDWARAMLANDPNGVGTAFDAMRAAPGQGETSWDAVDAIALHFNVLLDDADGGRMLASKQMSDASTNGEAASIARAHHDAWSDLHAKFTKLAAELF